MQALAIKYRPTTFDDVVEQSSIKIILKQQLESESIQHCYLFVGGAGTGKTTTARIFANEINKGQGNPIELDAASNNSVDDMRELIAQAQTKSLNSEYKVFIIDECHMITVQGWNAILKLIEEPPAKSIFIFCTTDPQKIPKTILSRVQRYDFQRISQQGIVNRLQYICDREVIGEDGLVRLEALEYIAKIADGGMRDAITLLDKCLAYSSELTLENVVDALGTVDYQTMIDLTDSIIDENESEMIKIIENIHSAGKDIKQFIKQYVHFLLDVKKYQIGCNWNYINIPKLGAYESWLKKHESQDFELLFKTIIQLNSDIKYSATAKLDVEATLLLNFYYFFQQ
jgi:DNA polymerase-3 subunit gamma/tau